MKDTITITTIVRGEVVDIEAATEVQEASGPRKLRKVVARGNALPKALRAQPNVTGKVNAAQIAAIVKAQAKRAKQARK
jgi:hypothetical protein